MVRLNNSTNGYSASNYQVSKTPGQGNFTTIQEAIDQALTTTPSQASPATIWIQDGQYNEDLTLYAYINLCGVSDPLIQSGVQIIGNAICPDPESGNLSLSNIYFTSPTINPALSFQSNSACNISLTNVYVDAGSGIAIEVTGSNVELMIQNSKINGSNAFPCLSLTAGLITILDCYQTSQSTASVVDNCDLKVIGGYSTDHYEVSNFGVLSLLTVSMEINFPAADIDATSNVIASNSYIYAGNIYMFTGTGNLSYSNISTIDGGFKLDPGLGLLGYQTSSGAYYAKLFSSELAETITAGGTTTLSSDSVEQQRFTGTLTQTVVMLSRLLLLLLLVYH